MYIYELDDYDDVIEVTLVDIELNENTLVFYIQIIPHSYMQNDDFEVGIWIDDLTEIETQIIDENDVVAMITDEVDDELDDDDALRQPIVADEMEENENTDIEVDDEDELMVVADENEKTDDEMDEAINLVGTLDVTE